MKYRIHYDWTTKFKWLESHGIYGSHESCYDWTTKFKWLEFWSYNSVGRQSYDWTTKFKWLEYRYFGQSNGSCYDWTTKFKWLEYLNLKGLRSKALRFIGAWEKSGLYLKKHVLVIFFMGFCNLSILDIDNVCELFVGEKQY